MERDGATAMDRCDALGAISEEPNRLTRQFAGEAMRRAHGEAAAWIGRPAWLLAKA